MYTGVLLRVFVCVFDGLIAIVNGLSHIYPLIINGLFN